MVFLELIEKKKGGAALSAEEIRWLVDAYVAGEIADFQMAAWLMAVRWQGLSDEETTALTGAMTVSGITFDFADISGPKVDKHSTGGVGDKVSLILAPLAAACGCVVPMVSGRGLGHTGGTLDKLEAIPGFRTDLTAAAFRAQLTDIGVAMGAQTEDLVPADRRLYELRSLTATVDETGLITASILSKKIAEGTEVLVLDVKTGSGAFMQRLEDAHRLADRLHSVATLSGLRCSVLITDMEQPLGMAVGNALEVAESIDVLARRDPGFAGSADLETLTIELTAEMLTLSGLAPDTRAARDTVVAALDDGSALRRFTAMVERQGGDPRIVDDTGLLPQAAQSLDLAAGADGYVAHLDARLIGEAGIALGAGRTRRDTPLDPGAGLRLHVKRGQPIARDATWATLYHGPGADLERAVTKLEAAFSLVPDKPEEVHLIKERRP